MSLDVGILASLDEPFINVANGLRDTVRRLGLTAEVLPIEAYCLRPDVGIRSAFVASNSREAWALASSLVRLGTFLLNGEPQVCDMERRRWKADLSAFGAATPAWLTATSPGPLMGEWPSAWFPAFLKDAGPGRGWARRFESQGDLGEFFQSQPGVGPWLIEVAVDDGVDEKVYVVDEPEAAFTFDGHSVRSTSPAIQSLAGLIRAATGLRYFSFDVCGSAEFPVVVDINRFPIYRNDAATWNRVGRDVHRQLRGRLTSFVD